MMPKNKHWLFICKLRVTLCISMCAWVCVYLHICAGLLQQVGIDMYIGIDMTGIVVHLSAYLV